MVVIDSVVRLLPDVLGNKASAPEDSFSTGLLEHPHYTRPANFRGMKVPNILLSGDHAKIKSWRKKTNHYSEHMKDEKNFCRIFHFQRKKKNFYQD